MAASITFDFVSRGGPALARDFKSAGDNAAAAAKGAKVLSNVIETLGQKENRTAQESVLLAKALRLTGDAEDRAAAKALAADIAIRRLGDAMQDTSKSTDSVRGGFAGLVGEVTGFGAASTAASSKSSMFAKALAGINLATGVLEPALAGVVVAAGGMAAAFASAGIGAGVFGVVAGGVFAKAKDAADKFTKSQEALNAATTSAQRQKALADQKAAFQGLNGSQVQLAKGILNVKDQWSKFIDAASPGVVKPAVAAMGLLPRVFQILKPFLAPVEHALTGIIGELRAGIGPGSQFSKIMADFAAHSGTSLKLALETAGHLFMGLLGVVHAFLPAGEGILVWAEKASEKFQKWGLTLSQHTGFQSLMTMFREQTPKAMEILRNLGTVVLNVGKAMTGLSTFSNSTSLLNMLLPLSGILATLSKNTALTQLALYLWAAHSAASKLIPAVQGVVGGIKLIGTALEFASANPIVLIAAAVIALGVAFYVAWQKSAGFRDVMKYIAQGFLGAGIIIVQVNKAIVSSFLSMVGSVLHAAATAFGWVPGLGDKLRGASRAFDGFKAGVDKTFDGVIGKMRQWQDSLDKSRSTSKDAANAIDADFSRQAKAAGTAKTALDQYSKSIGKNKTDTAAGVAARSKLYDDLVKAGVSSSTASRDVMAYTEQVRKNGTQSDGARTARQRLINDIAAAFRNSQQGKRDIDKLSAAIRDHGTKSDQARGARSRLLQDLINSGVDSRTAKSLVDKLQTSISNMHGKTVTVGVHGSGSGGAKITVSSVGGGAFAGKLVAISNRAAGGLINTGTGPTADDVPAMLSKGEFVHQTKAVNKYGVPAMKAVNAGKAVIRYAAGGLVSPAPDVWGGRVENSYGADGKSALGAVAASAYTAVINSVKAAMQKAAADAALAFALPGGGGKISGSAAAAMAWARNQLASGIYGWGLSNWPPLRALWMGESGWNYRAYNASSGATGIPQSLPGSKMASAGADWRTNPVTQMRWGLGYIRSVYGSPTTAYSRWLARSPHWYSEGGLIPGYAQGGLVPGYAAGGTVAKQGRTWLNAWRSRHGGGFGAAHGPVVVNEQIARMSAAMHRAQALAGAGGLSSGQHRFWANTAADEKKRLGVLGKELATERAWRYQLELNELGLDKEIRAAGNLPGLGGAVRGWKTQLGRDRATVAGISKMLGYSNAYLKAHPAHKAAPKVTPPGVPGSIPHTGAYTDSTADLISALFAASAQLNRTVTLDSGGTLAPGWNAAYNGTGRPEQLIPAGRGGGGTIVLANHGVIGSQAQLEDWLVRSYDNLKRKRRL